MAKGSGKPIPKVEVPTELSSTGAEELLDLLQTRFMDNMQRHEGLAWSDVAAKLTVQQSKLLALHAMESTGGEPDVIGFDEQTSEFWYVDCSTQTPKGRRSICYDAAGQAEREKKGLIPGGNAVSLAETMGIELLTEAQYRTLQQVGEFDTTTSSWIKTPDSIRELGGALFADRRYDHIFIYHNSAPSFYSARGFRGLLRV